jgi:hypothetical protein
LIDAAYGHKKAEYWARKTYFTARLYGDGNGEIEEEKFEKIPFVPEFFFGPLEDAFRKPEREVYWINPQRP